MKQTKRVYYFAIGAVLGLVSLYFIFGPFDWTPNVRVLQRLQATFQPTTNANCYLKCYTFGQAELDDLYVNGDVDFETKIIYDQANYEAQYDVVGKNRQGKEVRLTFDMNKDYSHLLYVKWEGGGELDCGCE